MLGRDSLEYDLLRHAAEAVMRQQVPGLTCEIGVRAGGGSQEIIEAIAGAPVRTTHVAIDPWGSLPYHQPCPSAYDNPMKRQCLADLYAYANDLAVDVLVFVLTDAEFFHRFADGVPIYADGGARRVNEYCLVHFDGPHSIDVIESEMRFFGPRAPVGAQWVIDDYLWFNWQRALRLAESFGFSDTHIGARKLVLTKRG
jgi:hypothetical protein